MSLDEYRDRYHSRLLDGSQLSEQALNYLHVERGLSDSTIRELSMGFCAPGDDVPDKDDPANRNLRGKVIIPIRAEFGETVAFAARAPDPEVKGWFNTRFRKLSHLFMFDKARKHIFNKNRAYIFEGYFDSILPWQAGLRNVCSAMGTRLGMRRIGLLARYCDSMCVCFDADANGEGQKAQERTIAHMGSIGVENVFRIDLPIGVDPDCLVVKEGIGGLLALERKVRVGEMRHLISVLLKEEQEGERKDLSSQ